MMFLSFQTSRFQGDFIFKGCGILQQFMMWFVCFTVHKLDLSSCQIRTYGNKLIWISGRKGCINGF